MHVISFIIDKPPCTSNPCNNGGSCRNIDNYKYRCDCAGTHYKGQTCDIGVIGIEQAPILRVNESVTVSVEVYPMDELHVHLTNTTTGISISADRLTFNSDTTRALYSITGKSSGIHFIQFSLSGDSIDQYEVPQPMMVIVLPINTSTTPHQPHDYYDNTHHGVINVTSTGCCPMESIHLTCPADPTVDLSLLSSCEWTNTSDTGGIIVSECNSSSSSCVLLSVIGGHIQSHYPILTPPSSISGYTCTGCNGSSCTPYTLTEHDVVDFIKSHSLARSFLKYTSINIPDWISISVKDIDSLYDNVFDSFDVIADVVHGSDVVLIDDCTNLDLVHSDVYAIVRTNALLTVTVDDDHIQYQPSSVPVCFAVSLCEHLPMVHVTIPQENQHELIEQITRIKVSPVYSTCSTCIYTVTTAHRILLIMDGL